MTEVLEKQGLSPQEIALPIGAKTFVLEDSGETVVMRKPLVEDYLSAQQDKKVETATEELLATISLVTTFNGKARNWSDMLKMSVMDYNELTLAYGELTRPKKMRAAE